MMVAIAFLALTRQDPQISGFPKLRLEIPTSGGQREVVLGPQKHGQTQLAYFYEHEVLPSYTTKTDTGGAWVPSVVPGGYVDKSLGYMNYSVRDTDLFSKPCKTLATESVARTEFDVNKMKTKFECSSRMQYWLDDEGNIIRQFFRLQTPASISTGDAVYKKDSIELNVTSRGKTTYREIFPADGLGPLNLQFKPMIVDGKIVMPVKEYQVLNPVTGTFEKYKATVGGHFHSNFMNMWFKGWHVEIESPDKLTQTAFISEEGDLIKVGLPNERQWIISAVPDSRMTPTGQVIRGTGPGGKG